MIRDSPSSWPALNHLSLRQRQVIDCVWDGLSDTAGANKLGIKHCTYRTQLERACKKLQIQGAQKPLLFALLVRVAPPEAQR